MLEAEGCVFDERGAVVQDCLFSPQPFDPAARVDFAPPAGPSEDAREAGADGSTEAAVRAEPRKRKER
jgi:hypothetical protein